MSYCDTFSPPTTSGSPLVSGLTRLVLSLAFLLAFSPDVLAQWSSDPAINLAVAEGAEDEVQPKVVPTPDGGVFISWFEGSGFDVRIQKLDADGNAVFDAEGILVADRGFSSTQNYGLSVDAAGNALLTFRDDRSGGVDITATLVTPDGMQPWGETGVQLTNTADFLGAPKVAAASDGGAFVAWTQNQTTRLQKVDADGAPQWTEDIVLTPITGIYFFSDLKAEGTDAILSIVHQTGGFSSPRYLLAQKYDADGTALWGDDVLTVFDGGSLQSGTFPTFALDGSGGAVFNWYDVAGAGLQSYVQRILSDGTEAFATNGLAVSTNTARERVVPDAVFDADAEDVYVYWVELANNQSLQGVSGQRFDADGNRLWTDEGIEISAVAEVAIGSVQTVLGESGAFAYWNSGAGFGQDQIFGANASGNEADGIDVLAFDVSTTPSSKGRVAAVNSTEGYDVVVWQDNRSGNEDLYAQNVNPDGSLGLVSADFSLDAVSLSFEVMAGSTSDPQTITLSNDGNGAGDFSITTEAPSALSLAADPENGTVEPDSEQDISLVVDATGATPGTYTASVFVTTDGADTPSFTVEVDIEVLPSVANEEGALPTVFALHQNYPNPFAGRTAIEYDVVEAVDVRIEVYDVTGSHVATLVDEVKAPGRYDVEWEAESLPSGVYLYRIEAGTFSRTLKTVLVR